MKKGNGKKRMVFVPNGAIGIRNGRFYLHRSYRPFLDELSGYLDHVIVSQLAVDFSENSFFDWKIDNHLNVAIEDLNISRQHSNIFLKLFNYIFAFFRIALAVKKESFFYICMPGHIPTIYAFLCRLLGKKYALYVRGDWRKGGGRLKEKFYGLLFSNASFILVTGANYLSRIKPWNSEAELVVPMIELSEDDLYRKRDFFLGYKVNLLFLSRIERAKGIFDLLDAFEEVQKQDHRVHLTIAGGGPDFLALQERCISKGLTETVTLTGFIGDKEKIIKLYRGADIFVCPSHHEGFPRVLYEAMCFSLPIITTFVGAIDSIMRDGENCLKINPGDRVDIEMKILRVINDQDLRTRIGTGALETMEKLLKGFINKTSHARQVIEWTKRVDIFG